jgi:hypothetical protein
VSPADRTPDEISKEIAETRNRLAGTIDQLVYRVQPKTIVGRQIESLKASFRREDGSLNTARVATVVGGVVGFVGLVVAIRKIAG